MYFRADDSPFRPDLWYDGFNNGWVINWDAHTGWIWELIETTPKYEETEEYFTESEALAVLSDQERLEGEAWAAEQRCALPAPFERIPVLHRTQESILRAA